MKVFLEILGTYLLEFAGPVWMLTATLREFRKSELSNLRKNLLLQALLSGIIFPGLGILIYSAQGEIGLAVFWFGLMWAAIFLGQLAYVWLISKFVRR